MELMYGIRDILDGIGADKASRDEVYREASDLYHIADLDGDGVLGNAEAASGGGRGGGRALLPGVAIQTLGVTILGWCGHCGAKRIHTRAQSKEGNMALRSMQILFGEVGAQQILGRTSDAIHPFLSS